MEYTLTEENDLIVVALKGEIDLGFSNDMREVLLKAVGDARGVVVDLSEVSMIDSSGIASLLEAFQNARKRGKDFVLAGADDSVLRVLKLARLDTVFHLEKDVDAAKKALA